MTDPRPLLRDLAFLYLAMAHVTDDYLTDAELEAVTAHLHARYAFLERAVVQDEVMEALSDFMEAEDTFQAARTLVEALEHHLSEEERADVLADLRGIAEADGLVQERERSLLDLLARRWALTAPVGAVSPPPSEQADPQAWDVVHDLAYLFLVLAYGTDHELSAPEVQIILNKLKEWQADRSEEQVRAVLQAAMERYSQGADEASLVASIEAVRDALPEAQRMAVLNDLIAIANADGVFLDSEEDLINRLMTAWDVAAYANYGRHGTKE